MLTRRDYLGMTASGCAALSLKTSLLLAQNLGPIITRPIPRTGEQLPIVGLGSSATFRELADGGERAALTEVISTFFENGGTVFDTAPGYGSSEEVAGSIVGEIGMRDKVFWATKLNVAGFRGGSADPAAARAQAEDSFRIIGREPIDLIQVHNIADMPTQFGILEELKDAGRVRYIGTTSTFKQQYDALEGLLRNEALDFFGVDYAVDNLDAEERFFPIAQDRGIGVMVYMPFGRTRLWNRVAGREVPAWAGDFGAHTWAQFFIKFAASHPAVTVVTPATSRPHHMVDNMGAAYGRLPNADERNRMIAYVEALPEA